MKKSIFIGSTLAIAVMFVSTAIAAKPVPPVPPSPSTTVVTACTKKVNGQLRIVSAASQCLPSETAISWNIAGTQGPAGPQGPQGPQGPSGVVATGTISGLVGIAAGSSTAWVFAGPTINVTTTATELITGAVQAPLGTIATEVASFKYDLCYRAAGSSVAPVNFAGANASAGEVTSAATVPFPAMGSVMPGSGTWEVGYCLLNSGAASLDHNDFANGWIIVTE